jgi:hypothetical protein
MLLEGVSAAIHEIAGLSMAPGYISNGDMHGVLEGFI